MSNFIASNGVELDGFGDCTMGYETYGRVHYARKEFYQHLRDKELGRWRSKKLPDFVVYPLHSEDVRVLNEVNGYSVLASAQVTLELDKTVHESVAAEYYAEHSKPWHSATEGDLWEVKYSGPAFIAMVSDKAEFIFTDKSSLPITDKNITDGARLWPEQSDG